jgi:hypothetical protein
MVIISFSIFLVAVINVLFGMFWYSPQFLGHTWAKAQHFNLRDMKPSPFHYVGAVAVSTVTAIVLANLVRIFEIHSLLDAIKVGFLCWLGFVATSHFSGVIWARKPLVVYFIDVSYLLCLILINMVLFELFSKL